MSWFANLFRRHSVNLDELQADTEGVLKSAFEAREQIGGAVNWARLHCCQAEEWRDQDRTHGVRVWIIKASPDATNLQSYVRTSLRERGWRNVEVRTEW